MPLLILLVTAHILADYAFQGSRMVDEKREMKLWGFVRHMACYLILAFVLSMNWVSWALALAIAVQTVCHGCIDALKIQFASKKPGLKFESDLLDMSLHLLIIWVTVIVFRPPYTGNPLPNAFRDAFPFLSEYTFYVYLAAVAFLLRGGTTLVRAILLKARKAVKEKKADNIGRLIGNIERVLIFILVLSGDMAAIGFIIAAKSIARFEEMKKKQFAEYYVIGTLTSVIIAILTGQLTVFVTRLLKAV